MAFARIGLLLVTLSWWYPDTYVLNCHFENLDHVFASWDQKLFGFQPALLWSKAYPSHIVSELMAMGYSLYFLNKEGVFTNMVSRQYEKAKVTEGGSFGTGRKWKLDTVKLSDRQIKELDLLFKDMTDFVGRDKK